MANSDEASAARGSTKARYLPIVGGKTSKRGQSCSSLPSPQAEARTFFDRQTADRLLAFLSNDCGVFTIPIKPLRTNGVVWNFRPSTGTTVDPT